MTPRAGLPLKRGARGVDGVGEGADFVDATGVQAGLWIGANVIVGGPLALAALVVARETIRSLVALALGFRVFEIQWGTGGRLFERPIGTVDLALARIPLGGATVARSGFPRRHRLTRSLIALAPALGQVLWLVFRTLGPADAGTSISTGPAGLVILDALCLGLLGLHLLFPIEIGPRARTDLALFFDAVLGPAESSRAARASYYARLARMRVERGDVAAARTALAQGLVQLGREPMLVASEARFDESELTSVVDQGECADALHGIIEDAEARAEASYSQASFAARSLRAAIRATPLAVFALVVLGYQTSRLAGVAESSWHAGALEVASAEQADDCGSYVVRWTKWARRIDRFHPPDPATRSDRHLALAALERCGGDLVAASEHQGEALLAANAARADLASEMFSQPDRWLANELRMTELFRHAASVETERRAFREALIAVTNAERRLETIRRQVGQWPEPEARSRAEGRLAEQHAELIATRERVMAGLASR